MTKAVLPACVSCGGTLTGRQKKYCSTECSKAVAREGNLDRIYGITQAEWDAIFAHQGGRCAICLRLPRANETFHTDHEHTKGQTGRLRGILCAFCNTRLVGKLKDHDKAQRLADYLRDPPATRALGREVIAPGRPPKKRKPRRKVVK